MTEVIVHVIKTTGEAMHMTRMKVDVWPIKKSWIWMNTMKVTKKGVLKFMVIGIVFRNFLKP